MRKLIAAMNMTLDGFCDHTAMIADEEIHQHYTDLLSCADTVIYGRITYQLMEYWKSVVENPTGNKAMDEFAVAIDKITKIVYSRTLKTVDWKNTELKNDKAPLFFTHGDADGVRLDHISEMFSLKGGGIFGDMQPRSESRLAILPNTTHVTLMNRMTTIVPMVNDFLDAKPQKQ